MNNIEYEILKRARLAVLGCKLEGIVHNLNSPLNTILGYAQILQNKYPQNNKLEKIYQAGLKIDNEFKNLADFINKFKSNKVFFLNLNNEIIEHLKIMNFHLFYKHHIDTATIFDENLPKLRISYADLHLLLDNLIANAIEAMEKEEEKKMQVETRYKNNNIHLLIKNIGSLPSDPEIVFNPKYTNHKNRKLGLGLPLCLYILKSYNGKIQLKTNNNYTTAEIIFPIKVADEK
ncbi:MAG: HAMP domain-containing sensor histidine kinase [Candidatus Cloacimonadota bacterium]|nr:HAMP domain-containing sensor histidine kinase [Candidatus Cloacimonadota bacterium]